MAVAVSFRKVLSESSITRAEQMIAKWDPDTSRSAYAGVTSIFLESRDEARRYLSAVHDLQQGIKRLMENDPDGSLSRTLPLMEVAMKRLRREFAELLQHNRDACPASLAPASSDVSHTFRYDSEDDESFTVAALDYLHDIAECMNRSGYGRDCAEIYKKSRRAVVVEGMLRLGFEYVSASQVQKLNWESLDFRINQWLAASRPLLAEIFARERLLCDYIFASFETTGDACFAEITRDPAVAFFRFPTLVASRNKKPPEKIPHYLNMYVSIKDLSPEVEALFSSKSTGAVRSQVDASLAKLSGAVKTMITDFESTVQKDASKSIPSGGGLHALTQSVMSHLVRLVDHAAVLAELFSDEPVPSSLATVYEPVKVTRGLEAIVEEEAPGGNGSSMATRFGCLIGVLFCKLNVKAELYKEAWQSYLFLTNNIQYVVNKVHRSKLGELLGPEWVSSHRNKARSFARGFLRVAWKRVLETIPDEPLNLPGVVARGERMLQFNKLFEEVCKSHEGWAVLDEKIRDEVTTAIARNLVGRYRPFYEMCRVENRTEEGAPAVVRFAPEDLVSYLCRLYCCDSGVWDRVSSSSSGSAGSGGSSIGSFWKWLRESV